MAKAIALLAAEEKREALTVALAARLLGKSGDTIYRWLAGGPLAGRQGGGGGGGRATRFPAGWRRGGWRGARWAGAGWSPATRWTRSGRQAWWSLLIEGDVGVGVLDAREFLHAVEDEVVQRALGLDADDGDDVGSPPAGVDGGDALELAQARRHFLGLAGFDVDEDAGAHGGSTSYGVPST